MPQITSTASQMLQDQWFGVAPMHASVLPIGYQDAVSLLSWAVGGWVDPPSANKLIAKQRAMQSPVAGDFYIPRSYLMTNLCDHEHK